MRALQSIALIAVVASGTVSLLYAGNLHRALDGMEVRLKDLKPQELFTLRMPSDKKSIPICQHFIRYRKDSNRFFPYLDLEVRHEDGTLEQISIPANAEIRVEQGCSPDAMRV